MHPSDGKESAAAGFARTKSIKRTAPPRERTTNWPAEGMPANFFRLLSFIHAGVIFFRMLYFPEMWKGRFVDLEIFENLCWFFKLMPMWFSGLHVRMIQDDKFSTVMRKMEFPKDTTNECSVYR